MYMATTPRTIHLYIINVARPPGKALKNAFLKTAFSLKTKVNKILYMLCTMFYQILRSN